MTAVAALDIGGTHVSAARVEPETARVESLLRVEYEPGAARRVLLEGIVGAAGSVRTPDVEAVGVAVPGPFDYDGGICTIRGVGKLDALYGVDLRAELARGLELPAERIVFLNDAEAFVLGEARYGAARGHVRVVGLTLGTGLGSAFLADGAIVRDGAGVPPGGEFHVLDFRGAPVEDAISARGLRARASGAADVRELAVAARAGDAAARHAFAGFAADLAEFVEPCVAAFGPTCIVVGGSIARAWDLVGPALAAAFPHVDVTVAAQIDESALLGVASYALSTSARL